MVPTAKPSPRATTKTLPVFAGAAKQIAASRVVTFSTKSNKEKPVTLAISLSKGTNVALAAKVGHPVVLALPKVPSGTGITYSYKTPAGKLITFVSTVTKGSSTTNLPGLSFKTPGTYVLTVKIGKVTRHVTVTIKK